MLDTETYEAAAVPAAAALAANRRRVVATGNRAFAERAAPQPLEGRWRGEAAAPRPPWLGRPQGSRSRPRPAVPSGCDHCCAARRAPKGSRVGGVAASGASNYWRPPRMQHGSSGSKTELFQSAGEAGDADSVARPPPPFPAASRPSWRPRLRAGPSQGQPRAPTRRALAPRPFVLHSIGRHLALRGLLMETVEDRVTPGGTPTSWHSPEVCSSPGLPRAPERAESASPGC